MSAFRSRSGGMAISMTFSRKYRSPRNVPCATASLRSSLVAAMMRTSTGVGLVSPMRTISICCNARSSLACISRGRLLTSSRNSVPPLASSIFPIMPPFLAPVNAPPT